MGIQEIKSLVRARDGYCCRDCGMTNDEHKKQHAGKSLEVHRVKARTRYTVNGCVTLCKRCHGLRPRATHERQLLVGGELKTIVIDCTKGNRRNAKIRKAIVRARNAAWPAVE